MFIPQFCRFFSLCNLEMCMQPREVGPCTEYVEKYYFNTLLGQCENFYFGGCNPDDNNFDSLYDCQSTCSSLINMTKKTDKKMPKIDMGE